MPKDKDYTNVPHQLLDGAARALEVGNAKYGKGKKRKASTEGDRYNSLIGHLQRYHAGEELDPEDGTNHLDCAAMQLAFLMEAVGDGGTSAGIEYWITTSGVNGVVEFWSIRPILDYGTWISENPINAYEGMVDYEDVPLAVINSSYPEKGGILQVRL